MKVLVSDISVPETLMRQSMSERALENLAKSMKAIDLQHPIGVRAKDGGFELVHGVRRLTAAKMLEWEEIEVSVVTGDDNLVEVIKVMENREREDVNAMDEGSYYKDLVNKKGWTQQKLADMLQVSPGYISQRIGSTEWVKSLREAVMVGALSFSTAREIAGIKDYEHMLYIVTHAARNGATPSVAREWKRRANLEFAEKQRQEAGVVEDSRPPEATVPKMHCHTCGGQAPVNEVSSFSVCTECRALIEEVKVQGLFKEHKAKEGATGGEAVETSTEGGE